MMPMNINLAMQTVLKIAIDLDPWTTDYYVQSCSMQLSAAAQSIISNVQKIDARCATTVATLCQQGRSLQV